MTYVEINLDSVRHNVSQVLKKGYEAHEVFAVIKDDAYGCGAVQVAKVLETFGFNKFVVARMSEASELRDARIRGEILVLGECSRKELEYASSGDIQIAINSIESLRNIITTSLNLNVHINIDTGMGRLGVIEKDYEECCRLLKNSEFIKVEALYSHFSCADSEENKLVSLQKKRFEKAQTEFKNNGVNVDYYHFPNSAGVVNQQRDKNLFSRVGILLYGCWPDPKIDPKINLKNVISLKTSVAMVKKIGPGDTVSYGANFIAKKETVIATVPAGYAHGIPRLLSGQMEVLIRGKRFPVVGNVTMDYIMVDVGMDTWIDSGEEVVVIGCQGSECITADEIAIKCNTIGYEILCSVGRNKEKRFVGR